MPDRKMGMAAPEPTEVERIDYDDMNNPNFENKYRRSAKVEGYGGLELAPGYEETDGERPPSGFLKSNNVKDRI